MRSFLLPAPAKAPGSSHCDRAEKSSCYNVSGVKKNCICLKREPKVTPAEHQSCSGVTELRFLLCFALNLTV